MCLCNTIIVTRVVSVMIEINRKLYIDDKANKTTNYDHVKRDIYDILSADCLRNEF